jgi:hypothetical protein
VEAVTIGELRTLAKLYRAGVEGAADRLMEIVRDERDHLPALLGFPPENVMRLLSDRDPLGLLVATIEGAPRVARALRARAENEKAQRLADVITGTLALDARGDCELPLADVVTLAQLGDHHRIAFGMRGGVSTRRLRDLFATCRHVTACSAFLRERTLDIVYETRSSRGIVRLHLRPAAPLERVVVLRLPDVEDASTSVETPSPTVEVDVQRPRLGSTGHAKASQEPRRVSSFVRYVFDSLIAATLGVGS